MRVGFIGTLGAARKAAREGILPTRVTEGFRSAFGHDPGDDDPMDPLSGKLAIVDPRGCWDRLRE